MSLLDECYQDGMDPSFRAHVLKADADTAFTELVCAYVQKHGMAA
jgi:hypothetical protein